MIHVTTEQIIHIINCSKKFSLAVQKTDYDSAFKIDYYIVQDYIKKNEATSESLFRLWNCLTIDIRNNLIADRVLEVKTQKGDSGTNFFVIHNYSGLAHEVVLRNYLSNCTGNYSIIYPFGKPTTNARLFYGNRVDKIYFLECDQALPVSSLFNQIKSFAAYCEINSLIFITNFYLCFWSSIFKRNYSHKFISMKYNPLQFEGIDCWVSGGCLNKNLTTINGDSWNTLFRPLVQRNKKVIENVDLVRLGSISRPEKINNVNYLHAIKEILLTTPNTIFLWFGRQQDDFVVNFFNQYELSGRCIFRGWVDPDLALSEIDIYVEPFPFGGGEMLHNAMEIGLPFVVLDNQLNTQTGISARYISSIIDGCVLRNVKLIVDNSYDYVKQIANLSKSYELRKSVSNEIYNKVRAASVNNRKFDKLFNTYFG